MRSNPPWVLFLIVTIQKVRDDMKRRCVLAEM